MKDFYLRRQIFLVILIAILIILPIAYISFKTFAPGLDINANLDLKDSPKLILQLSNNTSHTVNDLDIYLNDKLMQDINKLDINSQLYFEFPITQEKNILLIKADDHLDYEKSFSVNKDALQKDILDFKPEYIFGKVNEISDINMTICAKVDLNINLEINVDELSYNKLDNLIIQKDKCETKNYEFSFSEKGIKKVRFKIYNDVYSKELLISGNVN